MCAAQLSSVSISAFFDCCQTPWNLMSIVARCSIVHGGHHLHPESSGRLAVAGVVSLQTQCYSCTCMMPHLTAVDFLSRKYIEW